MHTVRNRIASRPPVTVSFVAESKPPIQRTSRQELGRLLRSPGHPDSTSMPCSLAPERTEERRPAKRRNPKGKKARKAAARKAAAAVAAANPALAAEAHKSKGRKDKRRKGGALAPPAVMAPPPAHPVTELEPGAMRDLCLQQAEPALALVLPSQPEPLVEASAPFAQADPVAEPAEARVLTMTSMPELLVETSKAEIAAEAAPALTLPDRPEPLVEIPVSLTAPLPLPQVAAITPPPAAALAALVDAQTAPLPRSRALVPVRRQGLVDVIAFLLRDSGRRLARWSARRQKTKAEQAALRNAQARQLNLQRELEALDALRRNRG